MVVNPAAWQIPPGVRDILPPEAFSRRKLEEKLSSLFLAWGYREIIPPSLEYYEQLKGSSAEEQLYKLIDPTGRILALRPDLTTPIARMVATHLREEPLPVRLFYFGNAFRYEALGGARQREFYQGGVELIGAAGTGADAEMLALAVEALRQAGLTEFQVGIGHVVLTDSFLANAGVAPELSKEIKWLIARKDFVGLENRLSALGLAGPLGQEIKNILALRGGREVLQKAKSLARIPAMVQAIEQLEEVYQSLDALGLARYVFFDFSILRDLEYYTGIVFEGYAAGLGYPVCGGGRYDHLLGQFGWDVPAIGFAFGIERLMQTLPGANEAPVDVLVVGGKVPERLKEAERLRQRGLKVEIDLLGRSRQEAAAYAARRNIAQVVGIPEEGENG
ncbi:MAG TPA: ATP phosphoribosyltransferase regulatory subunit [Clostridia bacterium]|nr:ATP phosphoribosyltransferase regulatory subunit [Clostridia bacterium]